MLYNTYWVRFNHRDFTHAEAVAQHAARCSTPPSEAGVGASCTSASPTRRKTRRWSTSAARPSSSGRSVESGLSLRHPPARRCSSASEDILINNIAWMLRRLPVFGVFGDGRYRLQPIYVDDLAALAVEQGSSARERHHRRHRAGDVHLPRAGDGDRQGHRPAAPHDQHASEIGSRVRSLARQDRSRRGDHPGRSCRSHAEPSRDDFFADRADSTDGVGYGAPRQPGAPLFGATGQAPRPPKELRRPTHACQVTNRLTPNTTTALCCKRALSLSKGGRSGGQAGASTGPSTSSGHRSAPVGGLKYGCNTKRRPNESTIGPLFRTSPSALSLSSIHSRPSQ